MALDISWISEGMPIFAFVLVFVLAYAVLAKTKILGGSSWINVIISFVLTTIFISFSSIREYVTNITPWFIVLLVVSFFFLMLLFFMVKEPAAFIKPITIVFVAIFALILIFMVFHNFPSTQAYLPGQNEAGANDFLLSIKHFILEERVLSGILLLITALIVGFIITR